VAPEGYTWVSREKMPCKVSIGGGLPRKGKFVVGKKTPPGFGVGEKKKTKNFRARIQGQKFPGRGGANFWREEKGLR